MSNIELANAIIYLKGIIESVQGTKNPFIKAQIAEKAIESAVEVIAELVDRDLKRGAV